MSQQIQFTSRIPSASTSISRSLLRCRFVFIALTCEFAWLALLPAARAVDPPPDGGYPGDNTAEGEDALFSLTIGLDNTAIGFNALYHNTTGNGNTANGWAALFNNTSGFTNTAAGVYSLISNTTGFLNTATGGFALGSNTTGFENTAIGNSALYGNTTGVLNTASGFQALFSNTIGNLNTANGVNALYSNTTGSNNTAAGLNALESNTTGSNNTAAGLAALRHNSTGEGNTANGFRALVRNTTGNDNIALGNNAGENLTTGSNNIDIFDRGVAGEANTIRIGRQGTQRTTFIAGISGATVTGTAVVVNSSGQLGVAPSSQRFKQNTQTMGDASDILLALRPVTFKYKPDTDPKGIPQFGLVAEDVEKVNRDLVVRDADGKPYTVRYEAVNAMLLNEFIKEHRKVQELEATIAELKSSASKQEATITELRSTVVQQQKGMEVLAATLKEQGSQIQKVSAHLEVSKPAPQTVVNNR